MTQKEFNFELSQHIPFLYEKAIFFAKNKQDAHDLVQDTLFKSLSNYHNYNGHSNIKGWLYIILKNTFISQYHKHKRISKNRCDIEVAEYAKTSPQFSTYHSVFSYISANEIMKQIKKLPENYLTPFMMHFRGYKYEEISKTIDLPLGTVKTRIHKARKLIKKKMNAIGYIHS